MKSCTIVAHDENGILAKLLQSHKQLTALAALLKIVKNNKAVQSIYLAHYRFSLKVCAP